MTNAQMTNDETNGLRSAFFVSSFVIRHSNIDSSFEFRHSSLAIVACLLIALIGCDKNSAVSVASPPRPVVPAGSCVITGTVKFSASKPVLTSIDVQCCGVPATIPDESAIINDNGTLKNVIVYIKDGPNVASEASHPPPVIDQKGCRYTPHVLAMRSDQPLTITTHDPTLHNVQIEGAANPPVNFSQTTPGEKRQVTLKSPDRLTLKCDVHPWMTAYVHVFDHSFFTVTGDDGKFRIPRLPPGTYTLIAWHEKYGELQQQITVTDDKPADVTFEYK
jgi:Carboxypeptidase regulatory-like domain